MAANEVEAQLDQGQTYYERERTSPSPTPSSDGTRPSHKSSVGRDPLKALQNAKHEKGDRVHMSDKIDGVRVKGTYTIKRVRAHKSGDYCEYQLIDVKTNEVYDKGAWVRETKLKRE